MARVVFVSLFAGIFGLVLARPGDVQGAAGAPPPPPPPSSIAPYPPASSWGSTCDIQICYDYIDACGQMYGGCTLAPHCGGPARPSFSKPPCSLTATITPVPSATPTPTYTPPGCSWPACWVYTDKCSQEQTLCTLHPKCGGPNQPTFPTDSCGPPPPWPTITSAPTTTYPTVSPPSSTSCFTICADYVNECGQMYGGCFPDPACTGGSVWPSFSKPPCTSTTSAYPTCGTKCVDAVNECGMKYGGCYDSCKGPFPFTPPPCPSKTASTTKTPPKPTKPPKHCKQRGRKKNKEPCSTTTATSKTTTATCNISICIDYIDACGQGYGGCTLARECGGPATPSFSTPYCSITRPAGPAAVAATATGVTRVKA